MEKAFYRWKGCSLEWLASCFITPGFHIPMSGKIPELATGLPRVQRFAALRKNRPHGILTSPPIKAGKAQATRKEWYPMRQILIGAIMAGAISSAGGAWGANPAQGNTALLSDMEVIGSAYGKLAAQIGDGSKTPSSLTLVDTLIERSKHAREQIPSGAEKLAGDKRDAFVLEYRSAIQGMIDTLGSVRAGLSAGDNGAAERSLDGLKPWTGPAHSNGFK